MDKAQKYARRINVEEFNSCNEYELARAYEAGYHEAEKDTIAIIESRISELLGDAQPTPILRYELQDLIKKIEEGEQ